MSIREATASSYDAVPYRALPYAFTHPRHLEVMATLFGMEPPDITGCRVLELGCAAGGNLIPQAVDLPHGAFLGIDLSSRQVQEGWELIESLGLRNVELRHANIMDIDDRWGRFDYIISHGVFSWIPPEVQEKLLEVSARNLAPNGVAFVSYNTYPGWHLAAIVRGLMRYHAAQFDQAEDQIAQAKALLQFMVELSNENGAMGLLLKQELEMLQTVNNDAYLFHEHLEADNAPLYFHEFIRRAEVQGLQYLGDAEFSTMLLRNLPEKAQQAFRQLPVVRQEQYMDFVRGRRFRKTMLCHRGIRLKRRVKPETMRQFHLALADGVESERVDIRNEKPCQFRRGGRRLTTGHRLTKAALMYLKEIHPRYVSFQDLYVTALARSGHRQPGPADPTSDAEVLGNNLLLGYTIDLLQLAVHPPRCVSELSPQPLANPLARLQAARGNPVTNQLHRSVWLDPLGRRLMCRLDGAHRRSDLVACVEQAIDAGEVTVRNADRRATKPDPTTLSGLLDEALAHLRDSALLVG